ncbi:hypothetical protein Tco_0646931 [Tanacetum coccineum]
MQVAQVMELILNQGFLISNKARCLDDSGEKDDDDEDDTEDDDDNDGNDVGDDNNDNDNDGNDDDNSDHERTESDRDENPNLNQSNEEHEEEEEDEYFDEFMYKEDDADNANEDNEEELDDAEELYKDVNVNLRKEDVEMTNVDQSGVDQHTVTQESGFEQEEKDAHVTHTAVHDIQKTEGPMQSSSVLSEFTEKFLNFDNVSLTDNEIASLMDTTVRHEEPSGQSSSLSTVPVMRNITESLEAAALAKSSSQLKSTYEVAASLSEFELTKILMDKMEEHKSYLKADYKRELYDALVKSYNTDKDVFDTYGEVFSLKRSQDDKDKDQDPFAGFDRGTKRRKSSKDVESSRDPKSKESKSTISSKGASALIISHL